MLILYYALDVLSLLYRIYKKLVTQSRIITKVPHI